MSMPQARTIRILVYGAIAVLMVVGNLYAFWPFVVANRQLQAFCDGLPAGTPIAQVQALAGHQGYAVTPPVGGVAQVDDPPSFGRRHCTLQVDPLGRLAARQAP